MYTKRLKKRLNSYLIGFNQIFYIHKKYFLLVSKISFKILVILVFYLTFLIIVFLLKFSSSELFLSESEQVSILSIKYLGIFFSLTIYLHSFKNTSG